jgi:hypothetical protein
MAAARAGMSRFLVVPLSLALLALAMSAPLAFAKNGGNSANAKICQKGGWEYYTTSDGTFFASEDDCTSYAAQGGTLTPVPTQCQDGGWQNYTTSDGTPFASEEGCVSYVDQGGTLVSFNVFQQFCLTVGVNATVVGGDYVDYECDTVTNAEVAAAGGLTDIMSTDCAPIGGTDLFFYVDPTDELHCVVPSSS